ncbi:hypothetical protein [Streptomyces mirabilis]|uniref:hypothetical protein n=1 Tax=Streptomyces mirabilis TaxID=68239 RepID=UPI0033E06690
MNAGVEVAAESSVALRLVRELHRRQTWYESDPDHWTDYVRTQVGGELIGLRVALGVALGYEAASGDVVPAAVLFYHQWLASDAGEGVVR